MECIAAFSIPMTGPLYALKYGEVVCFRLALLEPVICPLTVLLLVASGHEDGVQ